MRDMVAELDEPVFRWVLTDYVAPTHTETYSSGVTHIQDVEEILALRAAGEAIRNGTS